MKKISLILAGVMLATTVILAEDSNGQGLFRLEARGRAIHAGRDVEGVVQTNNVGIVSPLKTTRLAISDPYSPHPVYAYSNRGVGAGLTHQWNQAEAGCRPWHGGYSHWRYDEPTALVVPPTAAYHSTYAWGVGQVRSTPIHHQYGRGYAGMLGGAGSEDMFSRTPYWPSSTEQFGVYPVRAPW